MKKYFYSSDIILSWKVSSEQKIDKENKEACLTENPEDLDKPVFLRPFFFQ